ARRRIRERRSAMARIALLPFHWASDMNPSFAFARKLVARGHEVHYLGIADVEARVHAEGFDFTPLFDEAFPQGALAAQEARAAAGRPDGADAFRARVRATCAALRDGELEQRRAPRARTACSCRAGRRGSASPHQRRGCPWRASRAR